MPLLVQRGWVLHESEPRIPPGIGGNKSMTVFFSELFQVVLCFIPMGMSKCCNPLSSRQNRFVIMPWIYQPIALGKYLSM